MAVISVVVLWSETTITIWLWSQQPTVLMGNTLRYKHLSPCKHRHTLTMILCFISNINVLSAIRSYSSIKIKVLLVLQIGLHPCFDI